MGIRHAPSCFLYQSRRTGRRPEIQQNVSGTQNYQHESEAFRAGVKVGDNPHGETTDAHWRWMVGWVAAGEQALKAKMANIRGESLPPQGETK
jgi:hypothetical protein